MDAQARLIHLLKLAHAGEKAAAYAYAGHWRSVKRPPERERIRLMEQEELAHRACLHRMLTDFGEKPDRGRERLMTVIGRVAGAGCFVTGWYGPMYGAGRIEHRNVWEYVHAATFARECGHAELVEELLTMAEVEWDHEHYFRTQVEGHWLRKILRPWPSLPPRTDLRIPEALNALAAGRRVAPPHA
jgi:Ubiquinone biosynthesis protein COQ7